MAAKSKKDQLIEDAQKFALRGQFDKAAKNYEQILALDPSAISQRQKLADFLIKCGRNADARKELEIIGKHFSKSGFYLKAIAVYKQLQKLFPADIPLFLTLAELYEKHGLIANALAEYKNVYDFYEKNDNIPEALAILDKMQNVDPHNIPIRIKYAEACLKQGKGEEAYAVFTKTASLFLERRDKTALSKVCATVQHLFPNKQDFILEVLAEQISLGNADSAIDHLQSLLRSNPNNKQVWDLVVRAYQSLEQPQRVKIAYQHYLSFFPEEPGAMLGLISSLTAEQNFSDAVELLDKYDGILINSGFTQQLEQIYHSLDKIAPLNVRVMEGLKRVATAVGNESETHAISLKLQSLRDVSGDKEEVSPFSGLHFSEQPTTQDFSDHEVEVVTPSDTIVDTPWQVEEEIDIDIDIDESPFASLDQGPDIVPTAVNWLDSIGDLFDTITTAPSGVKFSAERESADAQSHFDLGQAFKEMGLYDEAINEFRQAAQDPTRRVECLIMQCACLRERGELEKSITMLETLLKPGLSKEENCAVKYELASGYEAAGRAEEASVLLNEINSTIPGFRDIRSRIDATNHSNTLDFSDEDLDDFGIK